MGVWGKIIIGDSRNMAEVADESISLIVTSPPYWHLKDYGVPGQIGYGQTLHDYLLDLARVWQECWRVLQPGRRLCINIGDQFARAIVYGRYKVIPLHAEIIAQCETIGFDYMGAIIWQKKTTMHTTGGAVVMGSFPYPPSGVVELDYEFILLFRKPGKQARISPEKKEAARLSRDEWKEYFSGHWTFGGERQVGHEAMFPEELPRRLIRMFSFPEEVVLDPFLGSGTTVRVALELGRSGIGYEIQPAFIPIIQEKLKLFMQQTTIIKREGTFPPVDPPQGYAPRIQDARPLVNPNQLKFGAESVYKVMAIREDFSLQMDNGLVVSLLGIRVPASRRERAMEYLRRYVLGKRVLLRFDRPPQASGAPIPVYLYLANKLFINRKMIEMGLADADRTVWHRYQDKFLEAEAKLANPK